MDARRSAGGAGGGYAPLTGDEERGVTSLWGTQQESPEDQAERLLDAAANEERRRARACVQWQIVLGGALVALILYVIVIAARGS